MKSTSKCLTISLLLAAFLFCSCSSDADKEDENYPKDGVYTGWPSLIVNVASGKVTRFQITFSYSGNTVQIDTTGSWKISNMEIIGMDLPADGNTLQIRGGFDESNDSLGITYTLVSSGGDSLTFGQGSATLGGVAE